MRPTAPSAGEVIPSVDRQAELAEAKKKNPDTVAWLYIPGAEIDDPVMQAEDNGYYLELDENGEYAMWGRCYNLTLRPAAHPFSQAIVRYQNTVKYWGTLGLDASFPTEEADSKDRAECGNSRHDTNRQQDAPCADTDVLTCSF